VAGEKKGLRQGNKQWGRKRLGKRKDFGRGERKWEGTKEEAVAGKELKNECKTERKRVFFFLSGLPLRHKGRPDKMSWNEKGRKKERKKARKKTRHTELEFLSWNETWKGKKIERKKERRKMHKEDKTHEVGKVGTR